jgi:hypothetical protein
MIHPTLYYSFLYHLLGDKRRKCPGKCKEEEIGDIQSVKKKVLVHEDEE